MADSPKVSFRIPQTIWDEFLKEIEKDPLVESPSQKIRELIIEYIKECRKKEEKVMRACLVNKEGLVFDKTEGNNLKAIKEWAKDRGDDEYTLIIYEEGKEISYRVRNNRFYK